ncbi:MAG: DNA recombination protein RmuC [Microbacteriaceae bacterium]|nr:DNA recombination protein RmuC [Microbacteriaceae bacterium]
MQRDELRAQLQSNFELVQKSLEQVREAGEKAAGSQREEASASRIELQQTLATTLDRMQTKISELTDSNSRKQQELIETMRKELETLRKGNEEKLEQMRATVDEKLQGTLEKRLTESFSLVQDRLNEVHQGLGEMKKLATDVGSLQKVLTNVKTRGGWGEVQLQRQLEDVLAPNQYEQNVKIRPDSNDVVEFAVKMPGRSEGEFVYLPIDSKFPQEDYEKLQQAQESGIAEDIAKYSSNLEKAIKAQAKTISEKYIHPPMSTDFAIMYLPTEGLFAEVVRKPGLTSELQNSFRVLVTGPTTLMSLLNSLQMGFKTLAIEKSASDVWKVLGAAKVAFDKYGEVMDKLAKQLETAQNTVRDVGTKTRKVKKTLAQVESYELPESSALLSLPNFDEDETEEKA